MNTIHPSSKSLVIDILSKSFDQNQSTNYVIRQDRHKKSRLRVLIAYCFNLCSAFGKTYESGDQSGCALVLFPDRKRLTLKTVLWDIKLAVTAIGLDRELGILKRETKIKEFHPKEPFCYLWFIGVFPEHQKKGIGSQLLQEIIEDSENKGKDIYLETSVLSNIPWYQKFGFEIYQTIEFTYTLYLMRRVCK
jgi:ribosomal protein S18 acetylase RimI-like enzyme